MNSLNKEWKKKISDSVKKHWSENYDTRVLAAKKISEKLKGTSWGKQSEFQKQTASRVHSGKIVSEETREKMRISRLNFVKEHPEIEKERGIKTGQKLKGKTHSSDIIEKVKEKWKNPEYREKRLKQMLKFKSPNKPEKTMIDIIAKHNLPYKFVGDGSLIIKGYNPDFCNCNGEKILIEVFGDYWHNRPDWKERDANRLEEFKSVGYETLIFWEHEIVKRKEFKESPTLNETQIIEIIKNERWHKE